MDIHTGMTVLVGPNGSGKTRALRAIQSALESTGRIASLGRKVRFLAAGRSSPFEHFRASVGGPGHQEHTEAAVGHTNYRDQWWKVESITGDLSGATASTSTVPVTFPNGLTRNLAPGPSSIISKAVVEVFATRFLETPVVLWLSESGNKVVLQDDKLAAKLGLKIEPDRNLPDLILADVGGEHPLFVFVEVVATDGAMHQRRKEAILVLTDAAGFPRDHVAFLTAYAHREAPGYRKTVSQLAWGSFAWFAAEPDQLVVMRDGVERPATLRSLL